MPLLESRTAPGPATLDHHDRVLGIFRTAGFSPAMTSHAYALLDAYVYGFAIQEASLPASDELAELAETIVVPLPDGLYPHLTAFTTDYVLQPGYDFGAEFDFGLDLILDGLEEAVAAETG